MKRVSVYSALLVCLIHIIGVSGAEGQQVLRKTGDQTACGENEVEVQDVDATGKLKFDETTKLPVMVKRKVFVCNQGGEALIGLHWGAALLGDNTRGGVGDVRIVQEGGNNVVRVLKDDKSAVRAAFELHYFFAMHDWKPWRPPVEEYPGGPLKGPARPNWAWGPFVSLNTKPVTDFKGQIFTSAGIGLMAGLPVGASSSINLGIGWLIDTDVKRLRHGVVDGTLTTLTPGKENDLLRSTTAQGLMLMLSYGFTLGPN